MWWGMREDAPGALQTCLQYLAMAHLNLSPLSRPKILTAESKQSFSCSQKDQQGLKVCCSDWIALLLAGMFVYLKPSSPNP